MREPELGPVIRRGDVEDDVRALGDPPGPAGTGTVRSNLIAYLERAIILHRAIAPAFAGLVTQPGVLNRFRELPNPMAGGTGLREEIAAHLRAERRLGRIPHRADVDTAATLIVGACHELILPSLFSGHQHEPAGTFAADIIKVVLTGIAPVH